MRDKLKHASIVVHRK